MVKLNWVHYLETAGEPTTNPEPHTVSRRGTLHLTSLLSGDRAGTH